MTKDAKGRGDAAPPDRLDWALLLEAYRVFYGQTGNPLFVWKALFTIDCYQEKMREEIKSPSSLLVPVPAWCWEYLCGISYFLQLASGISEHSPWEITKRELTEILKPMAKEGEEEAKSFLEKVARLDKDLSPAKAAELVKGLPEILGFVDGNHSNAFLDYWRWEKKRLVWAAWDQAEREGKKPKEILEAVSEMTGIYDEPTIRRYVKEAKGKALPRRRSKNPKPPKGKKG